MRFRICLLSLVALGLVVPGLSAQDTPREPVLVQDDGVTPPLPRWREGGTPYDATQALHPYSIVVPQPKDAPTSGVITSPPEYAPMRGVLFLYKPGHWTNVVIDCVVSLTADPSYDDIAYVVTRPSDQAAAQAALSGAGADMSKVVFFTKATDSVWIRDYGPHFIWQDGALALTDSHYYPGRPNDNFTPTRLGDDYLLVPTYDMGLYYSGGNFLPGPNQTAFVSALIRLDNPVGQGFDDDIIADLYHRYQGVDTLHIMPQLPFTVDGTGHIDMWMYLVDEETVIISEFKPGSNPTAIQITDDAVPYMQDLGFTVYRTPAWNTGTTHWTYTNAFRVNDRIFVPTYSGYPADTAAALATWQTAAGPEVGIVPIECTSIIPAAGAIHCIVMQVPRRVDPAPAACVVWPDGGELFVVGATRTIQWTATDTDNETIPQIDLYYTTDDGDTWEFIATTTDTGYYDWLVPDAETTEARIKVVATAADLDQAEAVSAGRFQIVAADQSIYEFSSGAGVDKFGWGDDTASWYEVSGVRLPVSTEISTLVSGAYTRLAVSDATGGDSDTNRYISLSPGSGRESTHVFEITIDEDPADIIDIEVFWEGYADDCTQIELYVWDYVEGQWGDGAGTFDQNAYMDNYAGNFDTELVGNIRTDFSRYIDTDGTMTFLLYTERGSYRSFHDYMSLTVTTLGGGIPGDIDGDGDIDLADLAILLASYDQCDGDPLYNPEADIDGDGCVDLGDLAILLAGYSG